MHVRAHYYVDWVADTYVTLTDANDGAMSITNDAEAVVAEVHSNYPGRRIFYVDTEGRIDELLHEDGEFIGFAPGKDAYGALVRES